MIFEVTNLEDKDVTKIVKIFIYKLRVPNFLLEVVVKILRVSDGLTDKVNIKNYSQCSGRNGFLYCGRSGRDPASRGRRHRSGPALLGQ